jgi:hypothetical protein
MGLSLSLRFRSDRFDFTSDLPEGYNAGNRFYGKDVAVYLSRELSTRGYPADFMDEDWGWLVFSQRGSENNFQVAIYNLAEHGEGGRPGVNEWGLWVQAFERRKVLGFLPRNAAVPVPRGLGEAIRASVQGLGTTPMPWTDGPGGDE